MKPEQRHVRLFIALVWLLALGAGAVWGITHGVTIGAMLSGFYAYMVVNPYAPLIFILFYAALRPLIFIPPMWLCIAAGGIFGFGWGAVYSLLAENLSATVGYAIGRFFRTSPTTSNMTSRVSRFRKLLDEQTFPTVMAMRAAYFPFDPVNYACGLLRVRWRPYFWGTLIGTPAPAITFVSFGATVNFSTFVTHLDQFDPSQLVNSEQLIISVLLLALSGVIAWLAYHHQRKV